MFVVKTNQEAKDEGNWRLERAVIRKGGGGDNEEVEEEAERSETDEDAGYNLVDEVEVVGKSIAEEEKGNLEHQGQRFHDKVEAPGIHSVDLALPMPTTIDKGSTHLDLGIAVEPLFSQHGDKRCEEGGGQTRVKDGLNADSSGIGAAPLRESGICGGRNVPKRGIGDNLEELEAHLTVIRLEITLNIDDESRCNRREQTGLYSHKN